MRAVIPRIIAVRSLFFLTLLLLATACGQKGGLYIPQEPPAARPAPAASAPAPAATAEEPPESAEDEGGRE